MDEATVALEGPGSLQEFTVYILSLKKEIDSQLKNLIANLEGYKLYPQMECALLSRGKRLRPILTILGGQSVGGSAEELYPLAVAIELIHTASLIHDDVVDEDRRRRGMDTLYKTWKNKAILTGDTFYALACNIITTYGPEIWQVVSDGAIDLCDGQFMDVTLTLDNCGEKEYFEKITKKSASLFKVSSRSGAIVGGGSSSEVEALGEYGKLFGITYQLRDDLMEIINDAASDLRNGRVTLPYLHLYSNGNSSVRQLLEQNFGKKKPRSNVMRMLKASLEEAGSIDYCRGKISEILDQTVKSIANLRNSQHKEQLVLFAETTLTP